MDIQDGRGANVIRLHAPVESRPPTPTAPAAQSFVQLVERQMKSCRRYGVSLAVLAIRLDGLPAVGQRHGQSVQVRLLELASHRLKGRLRGTDAIACTGADAFGVALFNVNTEVVAAIEARLFDELSAPYRVGDLSA
ncbi:MAG: diguanylate cyclase [Pseudomonadota bacterium]